MSNLAPDEVEQQAGRQVKKWGLGRVYRHLKASDRTIAGNAKGEVDGRLIEDHKHVVSQFLFPAVTSSRYLLSFLVAYLHEDIGLTKVQALQAYGAVVIALHYAIAEFFAGVDAELAGEPLSEDIEDQELEVRIPTELRKLCELGRGIRGEVLEWVAATRWGCSENGADRAVQLPPLDA